VKIKKPLLGAHVSVAGGLYEGIENAERLGAEVIQIFGASPRQWRVVLPAPTDIKRYRDAVRKSRVSLVYLHAPYLINLATENKALYKKSLGNLIAHLKIASLISARGLIFHLGSFKGEDRKAALRRIISGMNTALREVPGRAMLIMENSSGGGGKIGSTLSEMAELSRSAKSGRVDICLDTAHAYAAGEIRYERPSNIREFFSKWQSDIGLEKLEVIHANDSKSLFGSYLDRHENIGQGQIGLRGFRNLAREKILWDKGWILEVPGFEDSGPDKRNLDILKELF